MKPFVLFSGWMLQKHCTWHSFSTSQLLSLLLKSVYLPPPLTSVAEQACNIGIFMVVIYFDPVTVVSNKQEYVTNLSSYA